MDDDVTKQPSDLLSMMTASPTTTTNSTSSGSGLSDNSTVCRDFLRNVCRRGDRCRFAHPADPTSARRDVIEAASSGTVSSSTYGPHRGGVVFCHDFQNAAGCRRGAGCRFAHCSRLEEAVYRRTGMLPAGVSRKLIVDAAVARALWRGETPICIDFLKTGNCRRAPGKCRYRHVTSDEFEREQSRAAAVADDVTSVTTTTTTMAAANRKRKAPSDDDNDDVIDDEVDDDLEYDEERRCLPTTGNHLAEFVSATGNEYQLRRHQMSSAEINSFRFLHSSVGCGSDDVRVAAAGYPVGGAESWRFLFPVQSSPTAVHVPAVAAVALLPSAATSLFGLFPAVAPAAGHRYDVITDRFPVAYYSGCGGGISPAVAMATDTASLATAVTCPPRAGLRFY